ncbi:hypothetical protein EVAR_51577_1 [Eumeta japonica]|uniref:PiggyBac transposable element-derived protein domain-containing protein n=1 Tax=Eumeta variegata TaxID=151549 RepID=A0A4C1YIM3_EUMVA|nr:hypothetical protein EVAR_51577_1 [Eumeta japonica]
MFIKSKPGKYGLKVQCMCDAKTHYLYNAFIYTEKPLTQRNSSLSVPTQDVLKLTEPLYGSKRNVTGDSWFTSVELVDLLLQKGLTYVGTVRKNKREIPRSGLSGRRWRLRLPVRILSVQRINKTLHFRASSTTARGRASRLAGDAALRLTVSGCPLRARAMPYLYIFIFIYGLCFAPQLAGRGVTHDRPYRKVRTS